MQMRRCYFSSGSYTMLPSGKLLPRVTLEAYLLLDRALSFQQHPRRQ